MPPEPVEQNGRALFDRLQIGDLASELGRRIHDLEKNMSGARHEFQVLRESSNVVSESKLFRLHESVSVNTRRLCALQSANERASTSLEIMYVSAYDSCTEALPFCCCPCAVVLVLLPLCCCPCAVVLVLC